MVMNRLFHKRPNEERPDENQYYLVNFDISIIFIRNVIALYTVTKSPNKTISKLTTHDTRFKN